MLIGLDFDNTIVSYKEAIVVLAKEYFDFPNDLPLTKVSLRDFLRSKGQEDAWIKFQGLLYGPGMKYAVPYKDCVSSINELKRLGHELVIISHRSKYPYSGDMYDLHEFAKDWICENLLDQITAKDLPFFFLEKKQQKLEKIGHLSCDFFLDDLPSILQDKDFPENTMGILFSPDQKQSLDNFHSIHQWTDLVDIIARDR